ncbi:hypothetical protein [Glutamicibacter sp.]|uniref:hypothetical protein n=1 Tax=Glutamicibacter sp. TaxID=1931995 RepID=UPI002B4644B1|nr:hypothetical protein [Glutamicibacter sp.]HJX78653.1 hypothetical protein [Glutamicibacter sp.]
MIIDIQTMLFRITAQVFDENFKVKHEDSLDAGYLHVVRVDSILRTERAAIFRATYEWVDVWIPELRVGATMFDYGDIQGDKEEDLRRLCIATRVYLEGGAQIELRKRVFRKDPIPLVIIDVDGLEWRLGRNHFVVPYM